MKTSSKISLKSKISTTTPYPKLLKQLQLKFILSQIENVQINTESYANPFIPFQTTLHFTEETQMTM